MTTEEVWDEGETTKPSEQVRYLNKRENDFLEFIIYIATGSNRNGTFGYWTWKTTT